MKTKLFDYYIYKNAGLGWFRILGYGIQWKNLTKHPAYFSERNGYRKHYYIGKYSFRFVTPRV